MFGVTWVWVGGYLGFLCLSLAWGWVWVIYFVLGSFNACIFLGLMLVFVPVVMFCDLVFRGCTLVLGVCFMVILLVSVFGAFWVLWWF